MITTQNLNEKRNSTGSILMHGRAWWKRSGWEWGFGKHATSCSIGVHLFHGDSDDGIMFHFCLPWLFSLYISIDGVMKRGKECQFGAAIHNCTAWLYTGCYVMESNASDPWWRKTRSWSFPWEYRHHKTEILHPISRHPVYTDISKKHGGNSFLERYDDRKAAEKSVSQEFSYRYVRKNGDIQDRIATVHMDRMTWRMKWWPLLPFKKVRTSIDIAFNEEIGEGVDSWKGGTVGCGYDLKPGETSEQALRRMESERKFGR